jgi:hypothetical protein
MFDLVTDIPQPKDLGIMFKDIITNGKVKRKKSQCLLAGLYNSFCYKNEKSKEAQNYLISKEKFGVLLIYENNYIRTVNKIEMCRLQGFSDDYCDTITKKQAGSLLGDGWTLPIIEHIFNFIER